MALSEMFIFGKDWLGQMDGNVSMSYIGDLGCGKQLCSYVCDVIIFPGSCPDPHNTNREDISAVEFPQISLAGTSL